MTERHSARMHAQALYYAACAKAPFTPTPDPSPQGGGEQIAARAESLTERVRRLYENDGLPVREIARLAGVSERTIYKYAQKHDWKPRYAWTGGGRPQMRGERWWAAAADAEAAGRDFAPVRGAGARFVRREDRNKPFATGLKATDPQGAARAAAACAQAQPVADEAWRAAEKAYREREHERAWKETIKALKMAADFQEERKTRPPLPNDDEMEAAMAEVIRAWTDTLRDFRLAAEAERRGEG